MINLKMEAPYILKVLFPPSFFRNIQFWKTSEVLEIMNLCKSYSKLDKWLFFSCAGCPVGTILTMPLTGLLTKYGFDGGWASVFYVFGKNTDFLRI